MAETDDDNGQRRERHNLFISLKTTVEGLLANQSSNVWNTYGGLTRLCSDVENILKHRLKFIATDYENQMDYWPFVKGLKWLNPAMAPVIERLQKELKKRGEKNKGKIWVQESLRDHRLASHLKILVGNKQHLHRHYYEDAFLFQEKYFAALCICLQAVEQNKVSLLTNIDPVVLKFNPQFSKEPHHCRSASLPIHQVTLVSPSIQHSHSVTITPTPPFASPKKERILCQSDEHAVPIGIGLSPDDSRTTARDALCEVLRKSGSNSPPAIIIEKPFSFYDSINTDPLLNVDFSYENQNVFRSNKNENETMNVSSPKQTKKAVQRSVSEDALLLRPMSALGKITRRLDEVFIDPETDNASSSKRKKENSMNVFSDSEIMQSESRKIKKSSPDKLFKPSHKRSKSDHIGQIKPDLQPNDQIDSVKPAAKRKNDSRILSEGGSGVLQPPMPGQSLIHYLSSQDFHTCANLDKENAHFSISEALIAAIEQMKWNHIISPHKLTSDQEDGDSDEEIKQLKQRIRIRKRKRLKEKMREVPAFTEQTTSQSSTTPNSSPSTSVFSDSTGSSDDNQDIDLTLTDSKEDDQKAFNKMKSCGLSASLASLYSDADIHVEKNSSLEQNNSSFQKSSSNYLSAESVAISLLKKFSEKQLPKASDLHWLVSEQDAPQCLLPLPNLYPISPDDGENYDLLKSSLMTRLRGNMEWAPPRAQIIFNIHSNSRRNVVMTKQNYRCAGCGMKVEEGYSKRYRYCEYLGKYFCQCCHGNCLSYIPGRILKKWDFTKYYVSNFSYDLLNKIVNEPLFNIFDINPLLYRKVKVLDQLKDLRTQIHHLSYFLQVCKHGNSSYTEIEKLPKHWVEEMHVYSLADLTMVREGQRGQMYKSLKNVVTSAIAHVEGCQFCQCFAFICEMCKDEKDIIFPYQLTKVAICEACKTCFHKKCFVPEKCPKCARIEARKKRLAEDDT
ncbi:hypothetical protein CHS0354_027072 [Potamilus streckersoni]|uniref:RUN domain-containing protein n=1 Tax=Potamilus streckersoni TaxID=2493646 RepID=A0AAE0TEZ5_9BIVA|nr:hypothetical protein CHS0354_027072 [Potamilus streckersoni]